MTNDAPPESAPPESASPESAPPAPSTAAASPRPVTASSLKMLAPDTRAAMESVGERLTVDAGTILFAEDEQTNELYIIESGRVVSYRAGGEDDAEWPVLNLGPGDIVGEMSFLDGGARQLNARAETDCTLQRIHPFDLLELEGGDHFYDNLRASVGITVVQRLRVGTELHVATLQHQLELVRTQKQFGLFFLFTIMLFSIGMVVNNVVSTQILEVDVHTQQFAWQYLLVALVPCLVIVWMMKIPLSQIGLTTEGLRKSVTEGVVASVAVMALTAAAVIGSQLSDSVPDLRFTPGWSAVPGYLLHSFLQEVVARGFMQSSIQRFLNDRRGVKTVLLTSSVFGVFHIHFGLLAVVVTIVGCIVFGLFYLRHQNVAGVTLLHFFLGACVFSVGIL